MPEYVMNVMLLAFRDFVKILIRTGFSRIFSPACGPRSGPAKNLSCGYLWHYNVDSVNIHDMLSL